MDVSYVDYYRCVNAKGEEFVPCKQFFRAYNSLCPNEWVSIFMGAEEGIAMVSATAFEGMKVFDTLNGIQSTTAIRQTRCLHLEARQSVKPTRILSTRAAITAQTRRGWHRGKRLYG